MSSLASFLPPPSQPVWDRDEERRKAAARQAVTAMIPVGPAAPPYGQRNGWVPRTQDDFSDGGAFPEIQVAQFPQSMGRTEQASSSNALAVQLDAQGKVKYDVLARQGHSKDKIVYSKLSDLLPAEVVAEDDPSLARPDEEEIEETTEKTRLALEQLTQSKIEAAMPVRCAEKLGPAQYIRYTPAQQGAAFNSGAKQRVIRMVELQQDPMDPPKFRINQKIPRGPPSPPAPVMHSPTRKVTVKEQKEWKIPPCISNWKNAKGYTIPLDKRLAADGRGLQQVHINENFAKLAEALYIADRKARDAVEMRAQLEKKLAQKEKEKKEENLRQLAQKAREERAGIRTQVALEKDEDARERDQMRTKLQRERERDISEQIALGLPARGPNTSGETQFDQRLFNQSKGMDSGYADDEAYNVYDKPWRDGGSMGQHLYRPSRNVDKDVFVPDKEFSGTDRTAAARSGPVQFEKDEEDPFGLDQFLTQAKRASKRPKDDREKRADDRDKRTDDRDKRRRKD
ncbi:hypothetical protein B566_EDAN001468 [Ephemera danica]|nr:hypothetical protein B566_EDAN001468 [Ephemera danica]